jgi:hypothetical protein
MNQNRIDVTNWSLVYEMRAVRHQAPTPTPKDVLGWSLGVGS